MSNTVRVWDPLVRLFHWSLVCCFFANFLNDDGAAAHRWLGYTAASWVAVRIIWGFVGTPHARFGDFVPTPAKLIGYLRALLQGKEPRHIGHNPAAAIMMLTLMACVIGLGVTGWLTQTDRFWGEEWLEQVHETLAYVTLALVCLHAAAALLESWRHRENLILSMITGNKRAEK